MNLQVSIDTRSGFCFGVVYAIRMAEAVLKEEGHLYCLGDIVHNDEEVLRLRKMGLEVISHEDLADIRDAKVLIRAHGEPPSTYKIAYENNIELLDSSCPVVLKLQEAVRSSHVQDQSIYIYGKKGHPEVSGLLGQTEGKAVVFQNLEELNLKTMPRKIILYSQTTKSIDQFYDIVRRLREAGIEVHARDTICRQVSNRDKELRKFAISYHKVIFVAGTKSSNGKVLYNTCKEENENTYCISSVGELDKSWFETGDRVGVCGATSTPMWLMEKVKAALLAF
ncbi:MAG: 4-hydroxy-3-methylbut-2-enyl diphosphate reductase [Cytophagales bacterium]|nr:4-hydroxy-3-methylbut-2-enyl diphosphate reductase [Cytophagales bacterium]